MKRLNEKAFSFIEVVVVIAIISIVTAGSVLGVGALIGWKARQCAEEIVSVIREVKTDSMGKDAVVLEITHDSEYLYSQKRISEFKVESGKLNKGAYSDTKIFDKEVLGKTKSLSFEVTLRKKGDFAKGPSSGIELKYDLEALNSLVISFDRTSGSFKKVRINDDDDFCKDAENNVLNEMYVYSISVTQGSKTYIVYFEQLTGQVYSD